MNPANASLKLKLLLLLPVLILTGCVTQPQVSVETCPRYPLMPAASASKPSQPYSTSAQQDIVKWRKQLEDTPTIP